MPLKLSAHSKQQMGKTTKQDKNEFVNEFVEITVAIIFI